MLSIIKLTSENISEIPEESFFEAAQIVASEFRGLPPDDVYRQAFSRVTRPDPLSWVDALSLSAASMLGTDQRDAIFEQLRIESEEIPRSGIITDIGCGDGSTSSALFKNLQTPVSVQSFEINEKILVIV